MNNYKITFSDLKYVTEALQKGYDDKFIDYLNSFKGDNIYEKFQTILKAWEYDVSYTLNFNIAGVTTKIQLSYINSQFKDISTDIHIVEDGLEFIIGVPTEFENGTEVPIYNILKYIKISGISINLSDLSFHDRREIIDNLPANAYNVITKHIGKITNKIFEVDNPMLSHFKLNFLSYDPVAFLRSMVDGFDDMYFKDVLFHLSRKMDGKVILDSTPLEVEYYIEKTSNEVHTDNGISI